jgi:hypothetical protein
MASGREEGCSCFISELEPHPPLLPRSQPLFQQFQAFTIDELMPWACCPKPTPPIGSQPDAPTRQTFRQLARAVGRKGRLRCNCNQRILN